MLTASAYGVAVIQLCEATTERDAQKMPPFPWVLLVEREDTDIQTERGCTCHRHRKIYSLRPSVHQISGLFISSLFNSIGICE